MNVKGPDGKIIQFPDDTPPDSIKAAMAKFQEIYVEKTVEIPLYYRKNVDLVSSKLGNYFQNPTSAGPTWNAVDWYLKG